MLPKPHYPNWAKIQHREIKVWNGLDQYLYIQEIFFPITFQIKLFLYDLISLIIWATNYTYYQDMLDEEYILHKMRMRKSDIPLRKTKQLVTQTARINVLLIISIIIYGGGGAKIVYSCEYAKQSLFLYFIY